jgi:hypothetical protein
MESKFATLVRVQRGWAGERELAHGAHIVVNLDLNSRADVEPLQMRSVVLPCSVRMGVVPWWPEDRMAKQQIELYRATAQYTLTSAPSCFWATGMCKRVELRASSA